MARGVGGVLGRVPGSQGCTLFLKKHLTTQYGVRERDVVPIFGIKFESRPIFWVIFELFFLKKVRLSPLNGQISWIHFHVGLICKFDPALCRKCIFTV